MRSQRKLFIVTAILEVGGGLFLLCLPGLAIWLLLGVKVPSLEAIIIGRVGGMGLLAIGVTCWLARDDRPGRSHNSLLCGILIYNVGACVVLAIAGSIQHMAGLAIWPAVVLHAAMTIWYIAILRRLILISTFKWGFLN